MWFSQLLKKFNGHQTAKTGSSASASKPARWYPEDMNFQDAFHDMMSRIQNGCLVIPEGTACIIRNQFDGRCHLHDGERIDGKLQAVQQITSVVVPGTVKSIGHRAFAYCEHLEEITLGEGVQSLAHNVFTGCTKLRRVAIPSSIREISSWTFYDSGLTEPVFSADGRVLICYPQRAGQEEYAVPEGVEEIAAQAFMGVKSLRRIEFPKSLKRIRSQAFIDCGFEEALIPIGVELEPGAFSSFKGGMRIRFEEALDPLSERINACRAENRSFLCGRQIQLPEEKHWKDERFRALAERCAHREVAAMEEMADYFAALTGQAEEKQFYECAKQFWQVRAYQYGSGQARMNLLVWIRDNPERSMVSPGIEENLRGPASGELLNALGFLFFDEERSYWLDGVDDYGVVEVSSYESEDGPDEDGFGREDYYDWWYLDDCLTLPEGVGYIHSYSRHDKCCHEDDFLALHDQAAASISER